MTRFLILLTFVAAAVFAGAVCSGCGDSSSIIDAGSDRWPAVCSEPVYVSTCSDNSAAQCVRGNGESVTGCLVDVCPNGAHPTKGCDDAARVPCIASCPGSDGGTTDTGPGPILASPDGCWVSYSTGYHEDLDLLPGGSLRHVTGSGTENGTWTWRASEREILLSVQTYDEAADALSTVNMTLNVQSITSTSMTTTGAVWARSICQ